MPRGVHLGAEGGVDDDPPVAQLVAEALDHDRPVVGQMAGGLALLGQVGEQIAGRPVVQAGGAQPFFRGGLGQAAQLADEGAERPAELQRAAERVALPERQPARHARCRGDHDLVVGDLLDPPGAGAQGEDVAHPGLVDHLLVQLADPPAALLGVRADDEDAEETPVRDGAAGGHREPLGAGAAGDRAGDPVPDQPGAQLGEGVRGVAAGQHVEHRVEGGLRQAREGSGPADQGEQLVDVPGVQRGDRHQLLGQHVQRVARDAQRLDLPGPHPLGDHRGLHQVGSELGEDHAGGDGADLVAGPADPLQPGGDRGRRLHLDHQVDRAHVDAQLQAGGGHHGGQSAGLQLLLHQRALLLGDRAVVRPGQHRRRALGGAGLAHQLGGGVVLGQRRGGAAHIERSAGGALVGDLVQPVAEPLGEAPGVGEDDGRPVRLHQVDDPLLDVRPDRTGLLRVVGRRGGESSARSATGTTTERSKRLADGGWTMVAPRRGSGTGQPPRPGGRSRRGRSGGPGAPAARPAAPG